MLEKLYVSVCVYDTPPGTFVSHRKAYHLALINEQHVSEIQRLAHCLVPHTLRWRSHLPLAATRPVSDRQRRSAGRGARNSPFSYDYLNNPQLNEVFIRIKFNSLFQFIKIYLSLVKFD